MQNLYNLERINIWQFFIRIDYGSKQSLEILFSNPALKRFLKCQDDFPMTMVIKETWVECGLRIVVVMSCQLVVQRN